MKDYCMAGDNGGRDDSFMTNTEPKFRAAIEQAAKDTGFNVYVSPDAFDCNGKRLPHYIAVHTRERGRDHGPFWERYDVLKKEVKP